MKSFSRIFAVLAAALSFGGASPKTTRPMLSVPTRKGRGKSSGGKGRRYSKLRTCFREMRGMAVPQWNGYEPLQPLDKEVQS